MRTLYAIQHVPYEHPGMIRDWARSRQITLEPLPLYDEIPLPHLKPSDLLLVMGGPMGVNDDGQFPFLIREKTFIKEAVANGIPTVGICLGAQLIASVLGAEVIQNAHTEVGFFPITMTKAAARQPLFSDIPRIFTPFHWHSDTFFIPKGGIRVAGNDACMNQGFVGPGKVLGLQFHLEADKSLIDEWAQKLPPRTDPPYLQGRRQITAAAAHHVALNKTILETVLDRFYLTTL